MNSFSDENYLYFYIDQIVAFKVVLKLECQHRCKDLYEWSLIHMIALRSVIQIQYFLHAKFFSV